MIAPMRRWHIWEHQSLVALSDLLLNFIFHVQFQIIQNIEKGLF